VAGRDFPYRQRRGEEDIEGERRLFYVAATRAREQLALIAPHDEG
jgi:superfamily I DNA/RNA helicase